MADVRQSTITVAIGCKLPNGLIMELVEPPAKDTRQLLPAPIGKRVTLNGANSCLVDTPFGKVAAGTHKYGVTHVEKDFAIAWFERYKDMECVKRGQVFILQRQDEKSVAAETKERADDPQTRTGLEALVDKDTRLPKGVTRKKDESPEAEAA